VGSRCPRKLRSCGRTRSRTTTTLSSPKTDFPIRGLHAAAPFFVCVFSWDSHLTTCFHAMRFGHAPGATLSFTPHSPPSLSYLHFVKFNHTAFPCLYIPLGLNTLPSLALARGQVDQSTKSLSKHVLWVFQTRPPIRPSLVRGHPVIARTWTPSTDGSQ